MVGQIQVQDLDKQSTSEEVAPKILGSLSLSNNKCSNDEKPFQGNSKTITSTADKSTQYCGSSDEDKKLQDNSMKNHPSYRFEYLCDYIWDKALYFQVDTPKGIPMRVLQHPSSSVTVISRSWVDREGNKMIQCREARPYVFSKGRCTSSMKYKVTMKSGIYSIEIMGFVVSSIQDGIDVVLGENFWLKNHPISLAWGRKLSVTFNALPGDPKRVKVKAVPVKRLPPNSPVVLPEL